MAGEAGGVGKSTEIVTGSNIFEPFRYPREGHHSGDGALGDGEDEPDALDGGRLLASQQRPDAGRVDEGHCSEIEDKC